VAKKEQDLNKAYELLLKKRAENVLQSPTRSDIDKVKKTNFQTKPVPAETLSDVIKTIKNKGSLAQNVSDVVKTTPNDTMGITPAVVNKSPVNKSRFFNLDKRMGQGIADGAEDVAEVVQKEAPLLKNSKGFAKLLPMLGLGAAGLGALSIANKVQAGELGSAGLEAADITTDYLPGVGTAKFIVSPSELGNSELPEEEMLARQKFNEAMKNRIKG
jgi:hypothetical protein